MKTKRLRCLLPLAAALVAVLGFSCRGEEKRTPPPALPPEPPAETVAYFVSLPHGLHRISPADREKLARMKANPGPYVAAIAARYPGPVLPLLRDASAEHEWVRSVSLLSELDGAAAGQLLGSWYTELDARTIAGGDAAEVELAARERLMLVSSLGSQKFDPIVQRMLARLADMDSIGRNSALEYLGRAAAGDPAVAARLRAIVNDPQSPLRGDRAITNTLRWIEKEGKPR